MSLMQRRLTHAGLLALGVAIAAIFPMSGAQADVLNINPCDGSTLSQPFAPWDDPAWYELTTGGNFQSPSWTLSPGAQLVAGSEPYAATGSLGSRSLSLSQGSSAQSPPLCVGAAYPSIRFFIGGSGTVAVGFVYNGAYIPAGFASAGGTWQPTLPMVAQSALCSLLSGGSAQVSVLITALDGNPDVDDVFVDPWNRG